MKGYNTVNNVNKSHRKNYEYRRDMSVNPTLVHVPYRQTVVIVPVKKMCFYIILHFHSFSFNWLMTYNFKSSWPFQRGIEINKITLGTAGSWPHPLNGNDC